MDGRLPDVASLPELRIELGPAVDSIARAGRRLAELLRSVPEPSAPTRGLDWTLGELAAHLAVRTEQYGAYLAGTEKPEGDVAEMATMNDRQIKAEAGVPFEAHVARMTASVEGFVDATRGRLGTDPYPWHSGIPIDVATGTGLALAELLVHGYDVARSLGRPWRISAADARTVARASALLSPLFVDPEATRGRRATCRVLLRGGGPRFRLSVDDGTGSVGGPDGPADCTVSAEPVAFVLVSYGRMSRWRAAASGRIFAWGRRPWTALSLQRWYRSP